MAARDTMRETKRAPNDACKWCNGRFWYTSYSGGSPHERPCEYCNPAGLPRPKDLASALPKDVARALTTKGAPIPDSLWFGKWSPLREHVPGDAVRWRWSPLGNAVRGHLLKGQP